MSAALDPLLGEGTIMTLRMQKRLGDRLYLGCGLHRPADRGAH